MYSKQLSCTFSSVCTSLPQMLKNIQNKACQKPSKEGSTKQATKRKKEHAHMMTGSDDITLYQTWLRRRGTMFLSSQLVLAAVFEVNRIQNTHKNLMMWQKHNKNRIIHIRVLEKHKPCSRQWGIWCSHPGLMSFTRTPIYNINRLFIQKTPSLSTLMSSVLLSKQNLYYCLNKCVLYWRMLNV